MCTTMFYSLYILKTVKRQFYLIIMHQYFSRMHKEKGSGRALGLDLLFRYGLSFFFFYLFILAFYFRILILHTTDFNPRINKDNTFVIIFRLIWLWLLIAIMKRCAERSAQNIFCMLKNCYPFNFNIDTLIQKLIRRFHYIHILIEMAFMII